ncbi:MAG: hypothetical protein WD534_07495 [Phycisphaeraceae bacterium]
MHRIIHPLILLAALPLLAVLTATAVADAPAPAGVIEAQLALPDGVTVRQAIAVQRHARHMTTRDGEKLDIGLYATHHPGTLDGDRVRFDDLPVPGRYDLRFVLDDGAIVQGWDATVPQSDYVGDPPLEEGAREAILDKQRSDQFTAFGDDVHVLDLQGNLQNAALLMMQLRRRPFVGGGYRQGEWVWRVDRYQWEDPMEHTWAPYQERPYYALVRERLFEDDFRAKRMAYARYLGGIALTADEPTVNLERVVVPSPGPGVVAVEPDGTPIEPVILKGTDLSQYR